MNYIKNLTKISNYLLLFAFGIGLFSTLNLSVQAQSVTPPNEPSCQTASAGAAWNPYPLVTNLASPDITAGSCKDMPLLSFFPIDTNAGNPRERTIINNENISYHLYYNNGARSTTNNGGPNIINPVVRLQLIRESDTRYRLTANLSGDNVPTVNSAQKGGDLIINTPANTNFDIVGRNTLHYVDAVERKYEVETGQRSFPYDRLADNSTGGVVSNSVWTAFPNKTLPSTNGFQVKPQLEAGFLGYGYILGQISAVVNNPVEPTNQPPVLPGQEITVIRGQTGSFQGLNGTDPNNDYPLTYDLSNVPGGCSVTTPGSGQNGPGNTGPIISCVTNSTTPNRFSFIITPIDSRGLRGTPGTFIVNIIEPRLNALKECFVRGTSTPCNSTTLKPGDQISYRITVNNAGTAPATNVRIADTYDRVRLTSITNISDSGVNDATAGTINWQLGSLAVGASRFVTFEATISASVVNGDRIVNLAIVRSDGLPDITVTVEFPVVITSISATKECFVINTTTPCSNSELKAGSKITYRITVINTSAAVVNNVRVVDTYDRVRLNEITNLNPVGVIDSVAGTITFQLGNLIANETKVITFDATLTEAVRPGDTIVNIARVTADNLPEITVQVQFPVAGGNPILDTSDKTCVKLGTSTNCSSANLKPGESVSYTINVRNTGTGVARNVVVTDSYDKIRLSSITNIVPNGILDTNTATITWNVGDINVGQSVALKFDAVIASTVKNGDIIINTALIRADNLPDRTVRVDFPVVITPGRNVIPPRSGGPEILAFLAGFSLLGIGAYFYNKKSKLGTKFVPARKSEIK